MRSVLVLAMMACSCGNPNQPAPAAPAPAPPPAAPQPTPTAAPTAAPRAITAETFCERLTELASGCEAFAKLRAPQETCVREASAMLVHDHPDPQVMALMSCVVESNGCNATLQCIGDKLDDPEAGGGPLRACRRRASDPLLSAVGIPRAEWARRKGTGLTTYRAAASTKDAPIEMCGATAENRWLTTLACDDGSRPIGDRIAAERSRAGNVGPGGRCGSIIDHYVVACPEAKYDVFIDPYICPLPN